MSFEQDRLLNIIANRLKELKISERQACLRAGLSDSFIRNMRQGKSKFPRLDTLQKLSQVLAIDLFELKDEAAYETANAKLVKAPLWDKQNLVPVMGSVSCGNDGAFELNGQQLYQTMSPPGLYVGSQAYAVQIIGSSMEPRYQEGEIAYIDPTRKVRPGDYVVAQIFVSEYEPMQAFVKKYIKTTQNQVILEQFNPAKLLHFDKRQVKALHYVAMAGTAL